MTDAEEFILSTYVPIRDLSITNISRVTLVKNNFDGQKYIRRTLPKDCRDVYAILKEHSFPGIPQIMEVIYDGNTVILEEYVEGDSLSNIIVKVISQDLLLHFLTEMLHIMKWIHSHNICHRDIKEENILVRPNQSLVLIDFAIASLSSVSPEHTFIPDTLGTVTYAAPEQFGLACCDCRTDIYSFGKVCQNLVNNCNNLSESVRYMLDKIIQKCTEFHPDKRYQSVDEILNILKQPSLFHGSPSEHIIRFAHADYPLCVQIYNNEQKILKDFPPYDRFLFSRNIFKDVESDSAKHETLTEFYLLNNCILAVRMTFTYNTFLANKAVIANIYHARIIKFANNYEMQLSDIYESLSGFTVLGKYESLLNNETLMAYPL